MAGTGATIFSPLRMRPLELPQKCRGPGAAVQVANMKRDGLAKHAAIAFFIALIVYLAAYNFVEHRRERKGPWQVTFTKASAGMPALIISQPALAITNVQIVFTGAQSAGANAELTLAFAQPFPVPHAVPFGRIIFMDTTFLPGTIVFEVFGYEIQLIPRVLTIDKRERPWKSNEQIFLPAQDTNSMLELPGNRGRLRHPESLSHS